MKVSIAVTNRSNFIVGGQSLAGNPYDGHTLSQALEQVRRLTGAAVEEAYVENEATEGIKNSSRQCTSRVNGEECVRIK